MFTGSFSGKPIFSARVAARELLRMGKPVPQSFEKANSFTNPLGDNPARGWLLMLRSDLNALDVNALGDLVLTEIDQENVPRQPTLSVTAKNLVITKEPINLFPSNVANDPTSLYLVEVADARWRVENPYFNVPINYQHNTRAPAYGTSSGANVYYADSTNAGTAWTWQTMVTNVWSLMTTQLGAAPILPYTPNGAPEGFVFVGTSAWKALCLILDRIGCAVKWDHASGIYSIVQVGAADATSDALLAAADAAFLKIHDAECLSITRGKVPYGVRVFFHKFFQVIGQEEQIDRASTQWQTSENYTVDIVGPDAASAEPGTYHPIWDDLPAIYDSAGSLTNSSALNTRAQERSDNYYSNLRGIGGSRLWKVYRGLVVYNGLVPGSTIKLVSFRESQSGGVTTTVVRHPYPSIKIEDDGRMVDSIDRSSVSMQPPDFAPTFGVYPRPDRFVKLSSLTTTASRYPGSVYVRAGNAQIWVTLGTCWIEGANAESLSLSTYYRATVTGAKASDNLPIYTVSPSAGSGGKARVIRFSLPSALATTDASTAGCTVLKFWQGTDPGTPVTVYNMPSSSGNYVFSGASGAIGDASYQEVDDRYEIFQLECGADGAMVSLAQGGLGQNVSAWAGLVGIGSGASIQVTDLKGKSF